MQSSAPSLYLPTATVTDTRVPPSSSVSLYLLYSLPTPRLITRLVNDWGLCPPPVIISVTGGAGHFDLPSELHDAIQDGLLAAAKLTRAWIVTGGTDAGVMKLVADAVRESDQPITVLGIASWGILENRDQLEGCNGSKRPYMGTTNRSLNPQHSHFIFIDDGRTYETEGEAAYGAEVCFCALLEQEISRKGHRGVYNDFSRIGTVMVVVQGGPNTLKTALEAAQADTPIVVVEGSGGAADLLAMCWRLGHNDGHDSMATGKAMPLSSEAREHVKKCIQVRIGNPVLLRLHNSCVCAIHPDPGLPAYIIGVTRTGNQPRRLSASKSF